MFKPASLRVLFCLLMSVICCSGKEYGKVTTHKVAEGVYLFTTTPYADVGFCGNSVAVIGDDSVLVFDSTALPQTAETVLAEIRKLTDKPVRYLINSHWHWDHWGGNQVFQSAFPGLQVITQDKTRQMLIDVEPRWNGHGLKVDLPNFLQDFEKQIAAIKAKGAPEERVKAAEERLAVDKNFVAQKQSLHKVLANVTFSDSMTIQLGGREVKVLHASSITPGDAYIYLPKEKIVATGDILLNPYPYAIGGSYPTEWLATLNKISALAPSAIVPGHGDASTDGQLLQRNIALFQAVLDQVKESKSKGMSVDQTAEAVGKQAAQLAAQLGLTGPDAAQEFKGYFLDVFVKRAYRELDGPLGDLADGLPKD